MFFYAVRHKPSGKFLPVVETGKRGATHVSITDKRPPRLFKTGQHAASALRHWLAGRQSITYERNSSWFGEDDSEVHHTEPVPERKAKEMEIVRVRVKVDHD